MDRDQLRALQDRFLRLPAVVGFVKRMSENCPLWEAGPSAKDVREMVHPQWLAEFNRHIAEHPEEPETGPIDVPCPKCRAQAGKPCKNYKGQRKPFCKARGKPEPIKSVVRNLFD